MVIHSPIIIMINTADKELLISKWKVSPKKKKKKKGKSAQDTYAESRRGEVRNKFFLKMGTFVVVPGPGIYWSWWFPPPPSIWKIMFSSLSEKIRLLSHWVNMKITLKCIRKLTARFISFFLQVKEVSEVLFFRTINYDSDSYCASGKGGQEQILGNELNQKPEFRNSFGGLPVLESGIDRSGG